MSDITRAIDTYEIERRVKTTCTFRKFSESTNCDSIKSYMNGNDKIVKKLFTVTKFLKVQDILESKISMIGYKIFYSLPYFLY